MSSLWRKQNPRLRTPTRKYLKLTQDTLKNDVRLHFRHLDYKTDVIRNLRWYGQAASLNKQFKQWLKMHDVYYKSYDKYVSVVTDEERKKYEDECLIINEWLADIKMLIDGWFVSRQQPRNIPRIPEKPEVKKEIKQTNSEKRVSEISQPNGQTEKRASKVPTGIGQKAEKRALEVPTTSHKTIIVSCNADAKKKKKMKKNDIEKIHVAPLSSKNIPALFAVPNMDTTAGVNGMRLCKRIIFIKNGLSYSNYVPVTQVEADAKNMFGIERVVNVLDEKHQFKRHMVIKNWVNHVKPAKGAITAIPSNAPPPPAPPGPVLQKFVQIPVSTSSVVTPKPVVTPKTAVTPTRKILVTPKPAVTPTTKLVITPKQQQQPIKKMLPGPIVLIPFQNPNSNHIRSFKVSTPEKILKQTSLLKTEVKTEQPVLLPLAKHDSGKSDIKITSVFSLSGLKSHTQSRGNTSTVVSTQSNALKNNPIPQTCDRNDSTKGFSPFGNVVSIINNNNQAPTKRVNEILLHKTNTSVVSNIGTDNKNLNPSTVYLLMTHKGKQCLVQTNSHPDVKEKVMTHMEKINQLKPKEKVLEIIKAKSKSKKKKSKKDKSEHRKHRKSKKSQQKKTTKRAYSPSESSSDSDDSMQNEPEFPVITRTASFQMLKGVERALEENKLVTKNRELKIPKFPSVIVKSEIESESETESSSETDEMSMWKNAKVVIKEEPLDSSDDSDNTGYLNCFMKEQQATLETLIHQPNEDVPFPLVMIKKEPVSDNEYTPDQVPATSTVVKIKEEPLSDEDDQHADRIQPQCQTMQEETPEEESMDVRSSREDRVKQLKERIREKQTVLAAFRKRPRISLVNNV